VDNKEGQCQRPPLLTDDTPMKIEKCNRLVSVWPKQAEFQKPVRSQEQHSRMQAQVPGRRVEIIGWGLLNKEQACLQSMGEVRFFDSIGWHRIMMHQATTKKH
jgi:hypothetical protein